MARQLSASSENKGNHRGQPDTFCADPVKKGKVNFPDSLAGRAGIDYDMYSGYVNITSAPDYLFYWFFSAKNGDPNAPLIIWTNGATFSF
jgi:carboxypeptidase C (cathepsin A)